MPPAGSTRSVSVVRFDLWSSPERDRLRIPARQWDDPGRISLVPSTSCTVALRHGQRLLRNEREPGPLRRKYSLSGEIFGYYPITHQYFARYSVPVMHTETNGLGGVDAVKWLQKEWANVHRLKQDGVPIVGFTWYSLQDQVDWDTGLREDNGDVNPLGLCNLDRNINPVGHAYKKLISEWRQTCPPKAASWAYVRSCSESYGHPLTAEGARQSGSWMTSSVFLSALSDTNAVPKPIFKPHGCARISQPSLPVRRRPRPPCL